MSATPPEGAVCRPRDAGIPAWRKDVCMPVKRGKDGKGPYYQWGDSGKKYHYEPGIEDSREKAKDKATKQGRAARASGYRG